MRIAFLTFGLLYESPGHAKVQPFIDRVAGVFAGAQAHPGFVAHAPGRLNRYGADMRDWGERGAAPFMDDADPARSDAATLSIWEDLDSVYAFAYAGVHLEALQKRKEWFRPPQWPTYVAWWIGDDETPTWTDAFSRLETIYKQGPSPLAFNFKQAFDSAGIPLQLAVTR